MVCPDCNVAGTKASMKTMESTCSSYVRENVPYRTYGPRVAPSAETRKTRQDHGYAIPSMFRSKLFVGQCDSRRTQLQDVQREYASFFIHRPRVCGPTLREQANFFVTLRQ
jgi:hypothetical protein